MFIKGVVVLTTNIDIFAVVAGDCDVALLVFAAAFADVVAFAAVVAAALVVAVAFVATVVVAALYGVALVWFATYVDVDVGGIVLDAVASGVFTVTSKPNVTGD